MNASNQKHSTPFYISPRLFRNKRLQQRRCKWAARLKKIQLHSYARITTPSVALSQQTNKAATNTNTTTTSKTDRTKRPNNKQHQLQQQQQKQREQHQITNRQRFTSLKADITIDLLSDDDDNDADEDNVASIMRTSTPNPGGRGFITKQKTENNIVQSGSFYLHPSGSFQLSMVPNITLVPVQQQQQQLAQLQQHMVLDSSGADARRKRKSHRPRKRYAPPAATATVSLHNANDLSIVQITDDEDDYDAFNTSKHPINVKLLKGMPQLQPINRSPPPLAPLSQHVIASETVEEVTVSLVPRTATTAHCKQKQLVMHTNGIIGSSAVGAGGGVAVGVGVGANHGSSSSTNGDANDAFPMLPDETTVHTVIANRIYELSLSKLREGLASSGMPEFANDTTTTAAAAMTPTTTTTVQKLPPTLRSRKALPLITIATPTPPPPISLKLSSDLSISLISDDEGEYGSDVRPEGALNAASIANEAHAAAKLLQQQQPQLSVVQHLQYHHHHHHHQNAGVAAAAMCAQPTPPALAPAPPPPPPAAVANVIQRGGGGVATTTTPTPRRRKLG